MGTIKVNTDEYKERPDLPAGDYVCTLQKVEQKEGPNAPYLALELNIEEGPGEGLTVWDNVTLSSNAKWRVANFAKAFGGGEGEIEIDPEDFIGRPVVARCVPEQYEGYVNLRVKKYIMHEAVAEKIAEMTGEAPTTTTPEPATAGEKKEKKFNI